MNKRKSNSNTSITKKARNWFIIIGFAAGLIFLLAGKKVVKYTSTDSYCTSCHIHPMADQSWLLSTHHKTRSGNIIHCSECHLPPEGHGYLIAKAKHGFKDVYGYFFKDSADINWQAKKQLENEGSVKRVKRNPKKNKKKGK